MDELATAETTVKKRFVNVWQPLTDLKKVLAEKGEARVYIVATSCGMRSPGSTMTKIMDFANLHGIRYVDLESEEWNGKKGTKIVKTPALRIKVKSTEAFLNLWKDAVKLRSRSCGCSVFYSDGQAYDIRVMSTDSIAYGDRYQPSLASLSVDVLYE